LLHVPTLLSGIVGLFALCNYFWFTYNTVGYPWRNGRWPLNRGWSLNRGWCTLNIFSLSGYKFLSEHGVNCRFSHDVTKIQTTKLLIPLTFFFHDV